MSSESESLVRKYDFDRYLSALFAPEKRRAHLFALYAFNYEIAKTAETVREPVLGQIRLQWWRETVEGIYAGNVRRHDVAEAFADAVRLFDLPRDLVDGLIDARDFDLDALGFADMAALESYADATSGNLMRLAARILGAGGALDAQAQDAGRAYAITGLLRALAFRASRGRLMLPRDLVLAAGLDIDDILAGKETPLLKRVVAEMSDAARRHLKGAREDSVMRRYLPALLPASLAPLYLRLINRGDFEPFRDAPDLPVHRRQLAIIGAMMRGRV